MEGNTYTFYAPCSLLDVEAMQTWHIFITMDMENLPRFSDMETP